MSAITGSSRRSLLGLRIGELGELRRADVGGFRLWHAGGWFFVAASILGADWALNG